MQKDKPTDAELNALFAEKVAGWTIALGKHVVIVGRRENMQCFGYHMKKVGTVQEALEAISNLTSA